MTRLPIEQSVLIALQAVALVGLSLRFWLTGLYRTYIWFFAYLIVVLLQIAALVFVPLRSVLYLRIWMATEALALCSYSLVVLESYGNILGDLPGIASVARRYVKIALALAVLISLLLVLAEQTPSTFPQYFLVCDRTIVSSLLFFVLAALIFLLYYPIPLNRNIVTYSIGFSVFLLAKTVTFFIDNLRYYWWYRELNAMLLGISTGCLLFWLFALNPQGQARTVVVGHKWNPTEEKRLLSHLQAINDSLLRVAKK